jgi:hypothetical protein
MTLLLLFHPYRIPINLQLELCDSDIFLSLVSVENVLDQVDSQDFSFSKSLIPEVSLSCARSSHISLGLVWLAGTNQD